MYIWQCLLNLKIILENETTPKLKPLIVWSKVAPQCYSIWQLRPPMTPTTTLTLAVAGPKSWISLYTCFTATPGYIPPPAHFNMDVGKPPTPQTAAGPSGGGKRGRKPGGKG